MKVIDGRRYYTINETAELISVTKLTVHKWDVLSRKGKEVGMGRLVPEPKWTDGGNRMWNDDDIDKMRDFTTHMEYGQLSDYKSQYQKIKAKQIMEELMNNKQYRFEYNDNRGHDKVLEVKIVGSDKVYYNKYVNGEKKKEVDFDSVRGAVNFLLRKNILHI
jgi:hypothetical protein